MLKLNVLAYVLTEIKLKKKKIGSNILLLEIHVFTFTYGVYFNRPFLCSNIPNDLRTGSGPQTGGWGPLALEENTGGSNATQSLPAATGGGGKTNLLKETHHCRLYIPKMYFKYLSFCPMEERGSSQRCL